MKKILSILGCLFFIGLAQTAKAQYFDQAIGFRAGTSFELTYKRFVLYQPTYPIQLAVGGMVGFQLDEDGARGWPGKKEFIGNNVFIKNRQHNGFVLEALAYLHFDIGFNTGFSGFVGAGFFAGVYVEPSKKPIGGGGATGVLGIAYTFTHIPIDISIDWKPILGFPKSSITRGALTIRYILPAAWQGKSGPKKKKNYYKNKNNPKEDKKRDKKKGKEKPDVPQND